MSTPIYKFLTQLGSDNIQQTGSGEFFFYFRPTHGKRAYIERLIVHLEDTGSIDADGFGNGAALNRGLKIGVQRPSFGSDNWDFDLLDGQTIKTNGQWGGVCFDVDVRGWGTGDEVLAVRWTFGRSGQPLELDGGNDECVVVWFDEDLSGLNEHTMMVQGYYDD